MKRIIKYGLLVIRDNRILLQEEKDEKLLLLPGGKPRKGEDHLKCLRREIKEELNSEIKEDSIRPLGKFEDIAANGKSILSAELYIGDLARAPKPGNEVKKIVWFGTGDDFGKLSPVIRNKVIPYLQAVRLIK